MTTEAVEPPPPSTNLRPDRPQGPRLEKAQVDRAVEALIRHHNKVLSEKSKEKRKDLLGDSWDYIHIQLTMGKVPQHTGGPKPMPIRLPHPIYSADDGFSMCLIVKEDCKATVKAALDELHIDGVTDVIGLQELRTDYKEYQDRRTLRDAFDMFLVDDRIMAMLGRVLGKIFFRKKKQPVPLKLGAMLKGNAKVVAKKIEEARNCTYMFRSPGVCTSVKAARTDFAVAKAADNVLQAVNAMVENTPGKWHNVQSVSIKTPESVSLPIYNAMPSYLRKTPKEATAPAAAAAADGEKITTTTTTTGGEAAASPASGAEKKGKGQKRGRGAVAPAAVDEQLKPAKKTKGAAATEAAPASVAAGGGKKRKSVSSGKDEPQAASTVATATSTDSASKKKKTTAASPDKPSAKKAKAASPVAAKGKEASSPKVKGPPAKQAASGGGKKGQADKEASGGGVAIKKSKKVVVAGGKGKTRGKKN